jgi:hypothetical protein
MYRARVLEGDLPLIPVGPPLCCSVVEGASHGEGRDAPGGPWVIVDDGEEFVEDVVRDQVDGILEDIVVSVAEELACEVCFKEDALNIWDFSAVIWFEVLISLLLQGCIVLVLWLFVCFFCGVVCGICTVNLLCRVGFTILRKRKVSCFLTSCAILD